MRTWLVVAESAASQTFLTPYQAMLAMDMANVEGDLCTAVEGVRVFLGHRTARGEWLY